MSNEKILNSRNKKRITILCHFNCTVPQKTVFLHSKYEMCLSKNQMFDFLFHCNILYGVRFSEFCIKGSEKLPILGSGSVPKIERKNTE